MTLLNLGMGRLGATAETQPSWTSLPGHPVRHTVVVLSPGRVLRYKHTRSSSISRETGEALLPAEQGHALTVADGGSADPTSVHSADSRQLCAVQPISLVGKSLPGKQETSTTAYRA